MTKGYIVKYYKIRGWHHTGCEGWYDFDCDGVYADYNTANEVCKSYNKRSESTGDRYKVVEYTE